MAKVKHFVKKVRVEQSKDGKPIPIYRLIQSKTIEKSEIKRITL